MGSLSPRADADRQPRVGEVYEPSWSARSNQTRRSPLPAIVVMERCKDCKGCKSYEGQERGEDGTDPLRKARTRVFAAVIQPGAVTSNQISRGLRRSHVS